MHPDINKDAFKHPFWGLESQTDMEIFQAWLQKLNDPFSSLEVQFNYFNMPTEDPLV